MKKLLIGLLLAVLSLSFASPLFSNNGGGGDSTQRNSFLVNVDGAKPLAKMIRDGQYDNVNLLITEKHFRVRDKTKRTVVIVFFRFGKDVSSDEVIKKMRKEGYRPATIEELLALGEQYPYLQKQFPVAALNPWRTFLGLRYAPALYPSVLGRRLSLYWWGGKWPSNVRFAAVRK